MHGISDSVLLQFSKEHLNVIIHWILLIKYKFTALSYFYLEKVYFTPMKKVSCSYNPLTFLLVHLIPLIYPIPSKLIVGGFVRWFANVD